MNAHVTRVEEKHGRDCSRRSVMYDRRTDRVEPGSTGSGNEQAAEECDVA